VAAALAVLGGCGLWREAPPRQNWPILVVPHLSGPKGTVVVAGEESFGELGGLEGHQPFLQATDSAGEIVLEQDFQWPRTDQRLPVGDYTIRLHARTCDGFCSNLDNNDWDICVLPVRIEKDQEAVIVVGERMASCQLA
ncbi:MAG TPA: hypothetical protein VFH90_05335, partial [Candidatus Limnocylindria bacterium]|nr:hypothetical protein [Candidatus Limnocylindria bacterium]